MELCERVYNAVKAVIYKTHFSGIVGIILMRVCVMLIRIRDGHVNGGLCRMIL